MKPDTNVGQLLRRGIALHTAKDLDGAAQCYRQALSIDQNQADALHLLGTIEAQRRRYGQAVRLMEAAIRLRPNEPLFRNNLGNALLLANEPHLAVKQLREAIRLKPNYVEALCNLGKSLEACGEIDEAQAVLRRATEIDPTYERAKLALAQSKQRGGQAKQAAQDYRKLLERDANDAGAIVGLLISEKVTEREHSKEVASAERLLRERLVPKQHRSVLMHALGKAYDDLGRYEEAISLVIEAKKLDEVQYDMPARIEWGRKTKAVFTREFLAERRNFGSESQIPVFVIGMPRSGTTLTEQIIASHPKASGAGELPHISRISSLIGATSKELEVDASKLQALTPQSAQELAGAYLQRLNHNHSDRKKISDKSPLNLRYLGTISLLFQNARIIHCKRDPLDTCVSIFMQKFQRGHYYSYDLKTLGQFHRFCDDLIAHWRDTAPLEILEVDYESTVAEVETQARRIIDFIGLEWDDACLNFQETRRTVATASQWQVRQPVYATSVQRWRRYEKYLGPLIEGLRLE
jgi:tetratricopeptide (TPR) repeat protein